MAKSKINDEERRLWVLNDEGLWLWLQASKHTSEREFVKKHRAEIDKVINRELSKEPVS